MSGGLPAAFDLTPFSGSLLACEPSAWRGYRSTLDAIASGRVQIAAAGAARSRQSSPTQGKVGLIRVTGYLTDHPNFLSDCLGWSTFDAIGMSADQFAADPDISAVVVDVDSGGGSVMGAEECAGRIAALAQAKPTIGYVNSFCASAALWLAARTNLLLMMPSGQVGSVGVLLIHESFAGANAQAGIETTYLTSTAAPRKAEGNPDQALDSDARTYMLMQLDQYHRVFASAVARGRRTSIADVEANFGRGRTMGAADALRVGMVDGTETTLLKVIARAAAGEGSPKASRAAALAAPPVVSMSTEALRAEAATLAGPSRNPAVLRRRMEIDEELDARSSREREARMSAMSANRGRTMTVAEMRAEIAALERESLIDD